jgi:hypothetical protein
MEVYWLFDQYALIQTADFPAQEALYHWFLQEYVVNPFFVSSVPFTDKADFSRDGIINFHNNH